MKYIVSQQQLDIEDGVTVDIKSRVVTVKGPLGTLTRNFRHIPFEVYIDKNAKNGKPCLVFRMWLQKKRL